MEYHEAANIARKNPGAVLTRDASGTFIVRLTNGVVIGSSGNAAVVDAVHREREEHLDELSRVQTDFAFREDQLRHKISDLNETITKLKGSVNAAKLDAHQLSQQLEMLRAENASLQTKLAKVSAEEWERIKESDRVIRESYVARRKAERSTVNCQCLGEVESCIRCFGAGKYSVDGFGNRI